MKCSNCGARIGEKDVFCVECGHKIKSEQRNQTERKRRIRVITVILSCFVLMVVLYAVFFVFLNKEEKIQIQEYKNIETKGIEETEQVEGENDIVEKEIVEEEIIAEDEYIFENSNSCYLTEDDISGLTLQQLNYAKNEIYARHGRKFKSKELMDYFESKSWYEGKYDPDAFDMTYSKNILNEYEKKNLELLSEKEYELNPEGYQLDAK